MKPTRLNAATAFARICTLGPIEGARRWRSVTQFMSTATAGSELPDGVSFEYVNTPETLERVLEFIRIEFRCCPKLSYTIRPGSAAGMIALDIRSVDDVGALKALYAGFLSA